jgi:hypothetical protein
VNTKKKRNLDVNLTTQKSLNKIFKTIVIEDIFPFATGAPLEKKKYQNGPYAVSMACGKIINEKA